MGKETKNQISQSINLWMDRLAGMNEMCLKISGGGGERERGNAKDAVEGEQKEEVRT